MDLVLDLVAKMSAVSELCNLVGPRGSQTSLMSA